MQRDLTATAIGGLISALLWAGALTEMGNLRIYAGLAPLPLLVVGLGWGSGMAGLAVATGFVLALIFSTTLAGGIYGLAVALPAWVLVHQALSDRKLPGGGTAKPNAGQLLARITAFAAGFLLLVALVHFDAEDGFRGAVEAFTRRIVQHRFHMLPVPVQDELTGILIGFLPALSVWIWLLMLVMDGVIAQAIVKRLNQNRRPTPAYAQLEVPEWCYWAFVAATAVTLGAPENIAYVARNLVLVLAIPFFFIGLGVVHLATRRSPASRAFLAFFYLILFIFFGWIAIIVTAFGFFERWAGLRRRHGASAGGKV